MSDTTWSSPTIGAIAAALAAAQAQFGPLLKTKAVKNKDKTERFKYADLDAALESCRDTLNKNEIAIIQMPASSARQGIEVTSMLVHSSGEWIRTEPLFMPVSGGAQDVGSAITYARRYQLLALVGLAPEDDDGAAAQAAKPKRWRERDPQTPAPEPLCTGAAAPIAKSNDALVVSIAQLLAVEKGKVWRSACKAAGVDVLRPAQLTVSAGKAVKAQLERKLAELEQDPPEREPGDDGDEHDPTEETA